MHNVDDVSVSEVNLTASYLRMQEPRASRSESVVSAAFYEPGESGISIDKPVSGPTSVEHSKYSTKQSGHLPKWAWFIICKCLGICRHAKERPVFGTVLHIFTYASGIAYAACHLWYIVYDVCSLATNMDLLRGFVSVCLVSSWCAFGCYAKNLNGRLFTHQRFLKDIRMHSRTFFKLNAAFLVFFLMTVFLTMKDITAMSVFQDDHCLRIDLEPAVCKLLYVSRTVFSFFSLIWHSLVAFVLMSVCRTHTIGIRRFIRELECDAFMYEHYNSDLYLDEPMTREDICQETAWLDADQPASDFIQRNGGACDIGHQIEPRVNNSLFLRSCQSTGTAESLPADGIKEVRIAIVPMDKATEHQSSREEQKFFPVQEIRKGLTGEETLDNFSVTPHSMSTAEILHRYWKIACRLRLSSLAMQRWMASLICLVVAWCAMYMVYWMNNVASVYDLFQFAIPLMLLPMLCSAMSEVNAEGSRMTKCVCPMESRLMLLDFLNKYPLQMTVFGFGMSYGTIMTVVIGILVAFTSRLIVLDLH